MEVLTHTQMNSHCHVWLPQGLVERWTSGVLSVSGFSQKLWSTSNMIPTIIMSETIPLGQMKNWPRYEHNTIWLFNSSPWKITMLLIGKPSISMGHLYHGYVSHNQRVTQTPNVKITEEFGIMEHVFFWPWLTDASRIWASVCHEISMGKGHETFSQFLHLSPKLRMCRITDYFNYINHRLVVSNMTGLFSISYMGCHPSHWRTHIFQDGYCTTNQ